MSNETILKCAVAFFFLFFLHGISFGTRQQGISYNALRLCDRLPVCLPCALASSFRKTAVSRWHGSFTRNLIRKSNQ